MEAFYMKFTKYLLLMLVACTSSVALAKQCHNSCVAQGHAAGTVCGAQCVCVPATPDAHNSASSCQAYCNTTNQAYKFQNNTCTCINTAKPTGVQPSLIGSQNPYPKMAD